MTPVHPCQTTEYFLLQMMGNVDTTVKETVGQCLYTGKHCVLGRLTEQSFAMLMYTLKYTTLKQLGVI